MKEAALDREPKGWPAALIMFHVARWRERLSNGLADLDAGRPNTPPTVDINELNDQELPAGRGLTLEETSARADAALGALIELSSKVGDQPFQWGLTQTTGDALVRNSYFHPRMHISDYWLENGRNDRARRISTHLLPMKERHPPSGTARKPASPSLAGRASAIPAL